MDRTKNTDEWTSGYEAALNEAIGLVDAMRGPTTSGLASPILLRIRAELLALRETTVRTPAKAA